MDVKAKQAAYHDWESTHYDDKWSISFDERCVDYARGRYLKAVPDGRRHERVLEVGSGTGFFMLNLAQAGVIGEAHCADISAGMVQVCVANGRRLGIEVLGLVADAEALPYAAGSFDLVIGHAVVHHLPDLETSFAELGRVLRPGGRLVLAGEPTRAGDRVAMQFKRLGRVGVKLAAVAFGADRVLADGLAALPAAERHAAALEAEVDLHLFTPVELEGLARAAGFVEVAVQTEELTASWFGWATRTVEAMVRPGLLPDRYPWFAYRTWQRLFRLDEALAGIVPQGAFYNTILTGTAPGAAGQVVAAR
ncbi:class I SAM-dependent methyltransferase [soil metagenome]